MYLLVEERLVYNVQPKKKIYAEPNKTNQKVGVDGIMQCIERASIVEREQPKEFQKEKMEKNTPYKASSSPKMKSVVDC